MNNLQHPYIEVDAEDAGALLQTEEDGAGDGGADTVTSHLPHLDRSLPQHALVCTPR